MGRVDGVYVMWMYGYDATATLAVFKAAFTPALTTEAVAVKTEVMAFHSNLPQVTKVTFTVQHTKKWTALSLAGISGVVNVDTPVYSKVEGILSAEEKKTAPKVEITLGFAAALTTDQMLNVRTGIATAAGTPVDNVELKLKTRVQWNTSPLSMPRMRQLLTPSRPSWLTRRQLKLPSLLREHRRRRRLLRPL